MAGVDPELFVAAAALFISCVAFTATLMQCLQQYYASARGLAQCNEKVMGKWARSKSHRLIPREFRFEVEFDAPVIFVCPPDNDKGPVPDSTIHILDGTKESLESTWTELETNVLEDYKKMNEKDRIHTADNERASWTILLSAVQRMEQRSRVWQEQKFEKLKPSLPPRATDIDFGLPQEPPSLRSSHTLVVALQKKRRSWDTMPPNITKPYCTTTICHLVEMLAALGIFWKIFDRKTDRYHAEGNGFMVLGERVSDLGLMFTFQANGLSNFERKRVIPVDEIKELCFGRVPTIYRSTHDERRLEALDEVLDLSTLLMGNRHEIAQTLTMIGCNKKATSHFEDPKKRTAHLFNLSFEILAMLGQTLHVQDTRFTYVPNPTPDTWDRTAVDLSLMMKAFREFYMIDRPPNRTVFDRLGHHVKEILALKNEEDEQIDPNVRKLLLYRALHAALDDADEILTARSNVSRKLTKNGAHKTNDTKSQVSEFTGPWSCIQLLAGRIPKSKIVTNKNSRASKPAKSQPGLGPETKEQRDRRVMVQVVLRSHIQEVLGLLNSVDDRGWESTLRVPEHNLAQSNRQRRSPSPCSHYEGITPDFDEMDNASPDERQHAMMRVYFKKIRSFVVSQASTSANRRESMIGPPGRRGSVGSQTSSRYPVQDSSPVLTNPPPAILELEERPSAIALKELIVNTLDDTKSLGHGSTSPESPNDLHALVNEEVNYDDIWCTLVFRMICWLMLHDFNKLDKQASKGELLGSRMPVYIS